MDLRKLKQQFERDVKEICRELNNHPIGSFVRVFERLGIFKRYEELWGEQEEEVAQRILQRLKDRRKKKARRFILNLPGMFQGMGRRVWVISSSAQTADIRRFQNEKLRSIKEQVDLWDEWQEEIEERTGIPQARYGTRFDDILREMRQHLGLNGGPDTLPLPPGPKGDV